MMYLQYFLYETFGLVGWRTINIWNVFDIETVRTVWCGTSRAWCRE
jgi:hypothetical protein